MAEIVLGILKVVLLPAKYAICLQVTLHHLQVAQLETLTERGSTNWDESIVAVFDNMHSFEVGICAYNLNVFDF